MNDIEQHCPACRCLLNGVEVEVTDQAGKKAQLHEICFLRASHLEFQRRAMIYGQLLAALVHRLGDTAAVTHAEIEAGNAAGLLKTVDEPGGIVSITVGDGGRIILPGALPPKIPVPRRN